MMRREILRQMVGGKIFTAIFTKKDGTLRTINCRIGVKSHLNPYSKGLSMEQKRVEALNNYLRVFDMQKKSYRIVNCDTLKEIRIGGKKIFFS